MRSGRTATTATRRHRLAGVLQKLLRAAALFGALTSSCPLHADAPGDSRAYKLAPGDRINVTVFGQSELSGDIIVDGEGNIVMPFIGPIEVKDLTTLECQKLIRDRLADGIFNEPSVSVRISELRPLYILGDVRAPGVYPFRYGSTVRSALAAAGGFGLTERPQSVAISEFLLAEERVRQLSFQRRALLVRQARLEAQRDGMKTFSLPASPGPAEENDVAEMLTIEKEMFDSQSAMLQNQFQVLRSQKPRIQNEIDALNAQIASTKKQLTLITQHSEQYSRLVKQGLGTANAELQFKLSEASQESELWRLTAQVSRLQMDNGELDLKIHDAEATFKRQIIIELRDVRERLRELDVTLPSAREIRQVKLQQAGSLAEVEVSRSISITRTKSGEAAVIQAADTMFLEPGDIIEVKQLLPLEARYQNASARQRDPSLDRVEAAGAAQPTGSTSR